MSEAPVDAIPHLVERVMIARAAQLARSGAYAAADQLMAGLSSAAALDLRARMRAQQGLLSDAEQFWQLAARLEPEQPAYRDGLRRIAQLQRRPALWLLLTARVAAVILGLAMLLIVVQRLGRNGAGVRVDPVAGAARAATAGTPGASGAIVASPPGLDLAIDGVTVTPEGADLVARFAAGLFDHGVSLRPGAHDRIAALARGIAGSGGSLRVRVIGHTDDVPLRPGSAYADNVALGFARALLVAEHMRAAGVPAAAIAVESVGAVVAPPRGAAAADRAQHRTVTLRIATRTGGNAP